MTNFVQVDDMPNADGSHLRVFSDPIPGGTLYSSMLIGVNGNAIQISSPCFVPSSASSSLIRHLNLTSARSDAGATLTASPSAGVMGIARTAGTSLQLIGEATSSNAKTDYAMWEFSLPDSYVAAANIPVTINAIVTGAGTLNAGSTTITLAAYTEVNGVETAITVSAAQAFTKTGGDLVFTITGTGLAPSQRLVFEITMLVTTSAGACTGYINKISYQA